MTKEIKGFITGVILTVLMMNIGVFAYAITKTIEVAVNSINLMVDGEKVDIDNFIYNGTTYVPMRAVAEMLGKYVNWDDTTKTASINDNADIKNPEAIFELEDGGTIRLELYPNIAPNTVNNFISLANSGFYDGLIFHRVIPSFMVQGGCPLGTGTSGPGYSIKGEFSNNGFKNELKHSRGVISMARAANPDSAGSQFFIMTADSPHLDGQYAAFGKVISRIDVVDKIVSQERDGRDKPLKPQTMKSVRVNTFGVEYDKPVIIEK